ncbi:unnamed protein product, partial [Callosobruchus maculatus]
QEIKELKSYVQDLENQIQRYKTTSAFRCDKCMKAFITEDYLISHIKRRHNDPDKTPIKGEKTPETDQLQSEIKELKERLNATEKMLKDKTDHAEMKENKGIGSEVQEIYNKFEKFKEQVENEITALLKQKTFYEEKYNRLFEVVFQMKNAESQTVLPQKITGSTHTLIVDETRIKEADNISIDCKKSEQVHTTPKKLDVVTIQDNYYGDKAGDQPADSHTEVDNEEKVDGKIDRKISEISSSLEYKISASLITIQTQMESFWSKLTELQNKNQECTEPKQSHGTLTDREEASTVEPKIKPRTKLGCPTAVQNNQSSSATEKLKTQLDSHMYHREHIGDIEALRTVPEKNKSHLDRCDLGNEKKKQTNLHESAIQSRGQELSEQFEESNGDKIIEKLVVNPSRSPDWQLSTNKKIRERLEDLIRAKFEDIGVIFDGQGLPKKSFKNALEIIKHQANMNKKRYANYSLVRTSIEETLILAKSKDKLDTPDTSFKKKLSNFTKVRHRENSSQKL